MNNKCPLRPHCKLLQLLYSCLSDGQCFTMWSELLRWWLLSDWTAMSQLFTVSFTANVNQMGWQEVEYLSDSSPLIAPPPNQWHILFSIMCTAYSLGNDRKQTLNANDLVIRCVLYMPCVFLFDFFYYSLFRVKRSLKENVEKQRNLRSTLSG